MEKIATVLVFEEDQYNSMFEILFADILKLPDVYLLVEKNFPEEKIYRFLPSKKLKKLTCGLSDMLYLPYYRLPRKIKKLSSEYKRINILFHNASLRKPRYPLAVLDFIRKYPVKMSLIYLDKHEHAHVCSYANMLCEKNMFDSVMTFDPDDAKKYNIELCSTPYSKIGMNKIEECVQLYFCGSNAGRMYALYLIWLNARKRNVEIKYDLVGCQDFKQFFESDPGICFYETHVEYSQLLREMQKSSCILDITQLDQSGFTLRPYEAVVYNKKLLTNNKRIFRFRFYDERYMRYFEQIDDIDWDWLRETIRVDYGYKGEFSPKTLLQRMEVGRDA